MSINLNQGERLMSFLEFLGVDIKKYLLKRQVYEDQKTAGLLTKHKVLKDYVIAAAMNQDIPLLHRNPLSVRKEWAINGVYVEDFIFHHPDLATAIPLSELITNQTIGAVQKESMLYDVFDTSIMNYREQTVAQLDRYHQLLTFLPKKGDRYKSPSLVKFYSAILLIILILFIQKDATVIPFVGLQLKVFFEEYPLYANLLSVSGIILSLFAASFHVVGYLFKPKRFNPKERQKMMSKWENKMESLRLHQSGLLEEHVHHIMSSKAPKKLPVQVLLGPEKQLMKYRHYVVNLHQQGDFLRKYYRLIIKIMNYTFYGSLVLILWMVLLMMGIQGGWF